MPNADRADDGNLGIRWNTIESEIQRRSWRPEMLLYPKPSAIDAPKINFSQLPK